MPTRYGYTQVALEAIVSLAYKGGVGQAQLLKDLGKLEDKMAEIEAASIKLGRSVQPLNAQGVISQVKATTEQMHNLMSAASVMEPRLAESVQDVNASLAQLGNVKLTDRKELQVFLDQNIAALRTFSTAADVEYQKFKAVLVAADRDLKTLEATHRANLDQIQNMRKEGAKRDAAPLSGRGADDSWFTRSERKKLRGGVSEAEEKAIRKVAAERRKAFMEEIAQREAASKASERKIRLTEKEVAEVRKLTSAHLAGKVSADALMQSLMNMGKSAQSHLAPMQDAIDKQTGFQKAGQGMILSMSLMQASAGNLQQALFGLGFTFLFVGEGIKSATGAWAIFFAGIQLVLPLLTGAAKGVDKVQESIDRQNKSLSDWEKQLDRVIFAQKGLGEEGVDLVQKARDAEVAVSDLIEEWRTPDRGGSFFENLGEALSDAANGVRKFLGTGDDFKEWMDKTNESVKLFKDTNAELNREIDKTTSKHFKDLSQQADDRAFTRMIAGQRKAAELLQKQLEKAADTASDAAIKGIEEASKAREKALQASYKAEEEAVDDALKAQLDAREESYRKEVEASKQRVDKLVAKERELVDELNAIQARRKEIFGELTTLTDEIAVIERLGKQFGMGEELISNLAIRQARKASLQGQESQLAKRAGAIGGELAGVTQQKETEETLQQAARDRYDIDVEAYKDAADRQKEILKDRLDQALEAERAFTDRLIQNEEEARAAAQATIDRRMEGLNNLISLQETIRDRVKEERDWLTDIANLVDNRRYIEEALLYVLNAQKDALWSQEEAVRKLMGYTIVQGPFDAAHPLYGNQRNGYTYNPETGAYRLDWSADRYFTSSKHAGGVIPGTPGSTVMTPMQAGEVVIPLHGRLPLSVGAGSGSPTNETININISVAKMDATSQADLDKLATTISRKIGQRRTTADRSGKYY